MENRFTLTFQVAKDKEGQLLREAIAEWGISKRALTAIKFDGGQLKVNGQEQNVRHILNADDCVEVVFPQEQVSDGLVPQYGNLKIVYEDDALLIIDKPPFMNTIPSKEHPTGSVANYVRGYFEQQGISSTVHIVTRLDRDTSGLMCIAKHRHVHHLMSEQQKRGEIHRHYEAIVHGHVEAEEQSLILPIGRKNTSIIEREIREDGQYAHTDVKVLSRSMVDQMHYSHVRLTLHTGRTHQIRVHMAHIQHPLVGDELYGGSRERMDRQALHCCHVDFIHPMTKQQVHFESELPIEMAQFII